MIKKIVKKLLYKAGYKIKKIPKSYPPKKRIVEKFSMEAALQRAVARNIEVATVIDVGASDGRWSENCMKAYPNANYLLVEAQKGHLEGLKACAAKYDKVSYVLAAAGAAKGTIYFDDTELFGGVASATKLKENYIEVPVIAIDDQIKEEGLPGPYMLKLDTHGFEVPILQGAQEVLKQCSLVIIETYNFKLGDQALRYWEMCAHMDALGFWPLENVDLMLRELDEAFWQMDTLFIPKTHPILSKRGYR
ncbi:FkbM family methyltransferase [Sungkyunkwania multivorans]|uniref:FkbM family methyltransferase n=1 Tax=Sungkyunkwania multivorans TaxID=1173618 RepID=A0ABW3D226_9FLAO